MQRLGQRGADEHYPHLHGLIHSHDSTVSARCSLGRAKLAPSAGRNLAVRNIVMGRASHVPFLLRCRPRADERRGLTNNPGLTGAVPSELGRLTKLHTL